MQNRARTSIFSQTQHANRTFWCRKKTSGGNAYCAPHVMTRASVLSFLAGGAFFLGLAAAARSRNDAEKKRTAELMSFIIDNDSLFAAKCSADGIFEWVSSSCRAMYGDDPTDLVGLNGWLLVHEDDLLEPRGGHSPRRPVRCSQRNRQNRDPYRDRRDRSTCRPRSRDPSRLRPPFEKEIILS